MSTTPPLPPSKKAAGFPAACDDSMPAKISSLDIFVVVTSPFGMEAVAPIDVLQGYIRQAMTDRDNGIISTLIEQNKRLMAFLESHMPKGVYLDGNTLVGELTPAIDAGLNVRMRHVNRGNVR